MKRKILICSLLVVLLVGFGIATIPEPTREAKTQFSLSEWDFPDTYGQGIDGFRFYENSTGAWLSAPYYTHYYPDYHEELGVFYYLDYDQDYILNWSAGVAMKIRIYSILNTTLVGIADGDFTEGKNYQRHNVTVTNAGDTVFSLENCTYYDYEWLVGDLIYYEYEVILNFVPLQGEIYQVIITYEVYY